MNDNSIILFACCTIGFILLSYLIIFLMSKYRNGGLLGNDI